MRHPVLTTLLIFTCLMRASPLAARTDDLASAQQAFRHGDLKTARIGLRNAVRADPQSAEAHFWLGKVAFDLGDPATAEHEAAAARVRGFDPHQTVPLLARALLAQAKFEPLLQSLVPSGGDHRLDAAILVSRGYAQIGLRRTDDARKSFTDAEAIAPDAVEPLLADARLAASSGDLDRAKDRIDHALSIQPGSPDALLARAQLLRMRRNAPGAMAVLNAVIRDHPDALQAWLDRAALALAQNDIGLARGDLDHVLNAAPANARAIYLRAVLAAQIRDYAAADRDLERIAVLLPRMQRGFYLQAFVKQQLAQLEQAEAAANRYVSRMPDDMAGYRLLAGIQIARHQPDQAAATLAKAPAARKPGSETFDPIGRGDAAADQPDTARVTFQPALAPDDGAAVTLGHTLEFAPKLPAATEAPFYDALAIGDPDKAAAELTLIKETQGETAVTGNLTGLLALARIDLPAARTAFESVIKAYPDAMEAHINLARVLTMMGERNEADALLADLLARQPALEPALEMLASSYGRDGRQEDAVRLFEAAQAAEPANVGVLLALGDLYIRVGHARKILDLVAGQTGLVAASIDVRGLKAAALIALGEKQAARETYAAILDTDPKAMDARRRLGALLVENGAFEQARAVVAAGIAIAPRSYPIHLDLALIDLKDGGLDAALATADQLAARQPAFVALLGLRGDVELAANRPDDAVAAFADAYARDSDSGLVVRLADAQLRAARKDDAARTLAGWLAGHPDDLRVRELASEVDIRRDRLDDAAGHLAAILKRQPHDAVALNNLAWIFQQTGDPRAEGLARQAYVIAPGPQTSDTLGWILTSANDPETGVALLRRAVGESPTDPHLQYHYAVALQKTGRKEEAIRVLNRVVAAGGEFDEKTEARKLLEALEGT